ncbi:hypothetical protein [Leptospira mayottensis]|uniref:LysM domain-containing protein n=2 Tax=Leptospira mayottensis TaxID=1137606 RepID=A0AA87MKK6_9LEPT|nr:hypothetical protein [Leptospira mayottensis]AXR66570.1 hypothetical protein DQM28_20405 [Leptospira mayottensis]AXR66642.1 hypothetical protein DQM28_20855 [Leptospira mayottensis]AZQ04206.1 hypothetical protein LEP1GSC190_19320 [Leptospira mayottensis 200901116]EKR98071.1 hypothetical protein LEP1GSC125_1559 [Leptospira mayottensis 200901122]TGN04315.1 hypothetical protein EHR03_10760 [Leptospira mayottensis]
MGITDLAQSGVNTLLGLNSYEPQNVFSFAFYEKEKNGDYNLNTIESNEYFFVNGPLTYTENFKYRTSISKTFGSSVVIDYGPDNHEIKLEGEFHIYHLGLPSKPSSSISGGSGFVQSAFTAAKSIVKNQLTSYYNKLRSSYLSFGGGDFRSGLQEFQDFMFLLHYSKSLERVEYTSNDSQASKIVSLFYEKRFSFRTHALVFRDYDRNRIVEVVIPNNGFTISRSVSDTNTYKYSLTLVTVKELETQITSKSVRSNFNVFRTISGLMNELENIVNLPLKLSGALLGVANGVQVFASSTKRVLTSWPRMKDQFNTQGKLARKTFENAKNELGIKTKKRGLSEDEILEKIEITSKKSASHEAEFRQNLDTAINDSNSLTRLIAQVLIPVDSSGSIEAMSLQPNADLSDWIDNDVYRYTITIQEILTEIKAFLNTSSIDNEYKIYQVSPGDSWENVAEKTLGDKNLGQALARFNMSRDTVNLDKRAIKIPYGKNTNIYTPLPDNPNPKDLEIAIIGCDLKLNENRGIEISPTGDLALVMGDEALVNEKLDIIDMVEGSYLSDKTLGNPILPGEILDEMLKNKHIQNILSQFRSDPRVKTVNFLNTLQEKDTYYFNIKIESITGTSYILSV